MNKFRAGETSYTKAISQGVFINSEGRRFEAGKERRTGVIAHDLNDWKGFDLLCFQRKVQLGGLCSIKVAPRGVASCY